MKNNSTKEIIAQLNELSLILDKIKEQKENSKECPFAQNCKYRLSLSN